MTNLTVKDVINQSGGSFQIQYGDFGIVAPTNDVHKGIALLRKTRDRNVVMESVKLSIERILPLVKSGNATQEDAINCAQDITIWFANEILEGRKDLDQKNLAFIQDKSTIDN